MQEKPVVVKESNSNGVAIFAILAVLVVLGAGLYFWQPWNGGTHNTTNIITQPAAGGAAKSGGDASQSSSAGSTGSNAGAGTSGAAGSGAAGSGTTGSSSSDTSK